MDTLYRIGKNVFVRVAVAILVGLFFHFSVSAATAQFPWNAGAPPYGSFSTVNGYFGSQTPEWRNGRCGGNFSFYVSVTEPEGGTSQVTCSDVDPSIPVSTPDDQQCKDNALAASTQFGDRTIKLTGSSTTHPPSGSYCLPSSGVSSGKGCTFDYAMDMGFQAGDPPVWYSTGNATAKLNTGSCTLSTTPSPTTPVKATDACPSGFPGTVNGVTVCIPASTQPTVTTKTVNEVVTPPGGTPQNTETVSTTTCTAAGSCTTVNNVTVNGSPPTTTSTTVGKTQFCTSNPSSAQCTGTGTGASSGFGGNCISGFVGTGDALQKATAEAVNKTNCLLDPGTALAAVSDALAAGTFGPDLTKTTKSITQFNQTNPLGSTPLADYTIVTGIGSFVIPFSAMAGLLAALGNIAVIFTLIYATLFVVKGF